MRLFFDALCFNTKGLPYLCTELRQLIYSFYKSPQQIRLKVMDVDVYIDIGVSNA